MPVSLGPEYRRMLEEIEADPLEQLIFDAGLPLIASRGVTGAMGGGT